MLAVLNSAILSLGSWPEHATTPSSPKICIEGFLVQPGGQNGKYRRGIRNDIHCGPSLREILGALLKVPLCFPPPKLAGRHGCVFIVETCHSRQTLSR